MWDALWLGADIATMELGGASFGLVEAGAIGVSGGRIVHVGTEAALPDTPETLAREVVRCGGGVITPGLCDPHTHVVHAGHRLGDWELRLAGATRDDLARVNGGVRGTMLTTRAASDAELLAESASRVSALISNGVTTLECKSGYGLDTPTELRLLRASREIGRRMPIGIVNTFMGAHGLPPEYDGDADGYVDLLCDTKLPQAVAEELVDLVDAYCDFVAWIAAAAAGVG